jgi:CRISPR-associated endonuclease Csn1
MSDQSAKPADFVLGIDLGTNSVGWAIVAWRDGGPVELSRAGSRIFDAGMDVDNKSGKESSRNLARRNARQVRRQHGRRARRLKKVFRLLKSYGLLPNKSVVTAEQRQDFINELDRSIIASPWFHSKARSLAGAGPDDVMPYLLRAAALDEPLDPYLLGRALFHLAQRRGFRTNRKDAAGTQDSEEELGKVKSGISDLQKEIAASGARTLGEHFSRLDPHEKRIRQRWTARSMYTDEFDKVWDSQCGFHAELLTPERRKELRNAIFFQRKLKPADHLIGECELEQGHRRAPAYLLTAQRFRLLQKVNTLRFSSGGALEEGLSRDQRERLVRALELQGDQLFHAPPRNADAPNICALLELPKATRFNLQEGGEKKLAGNRTASQFYRILGDRWLSMSATEREQAVEYVSSFEQTGKLAEAAQKKWALNPEAAQGLANVTLEAGYMAFSRKAIEKLLPSLEDGCNLADAIFNAYGPPKQTSVPLDLLPPVDRWRDIRNPGVMRSLSELRKVVNAVIRQFGKPAEVRIELARDLRQTKAQRERAWKKSRENERSREKAKKRISEDTGLTQPSGEDIRKVLLAEECHYTCPYTGRAISMAALVGRESQFDIEHIIPFSRSLDNSFANLTLCYHEENRNVKRNRTPREVYASDSEKFEEILGCVKTFRPDFAKEKLRRFRMTTQEVDEAFAKFTSRQLNDTRYATKVAADYLALLYGGRVDANHRQRIRATAGQVTAFLRNEWKLNTILQDGPTTNGGATPKSRDDHRHHAVDAVVTALTDDGTIQALSRAAERAPLEHRRRFAKLEGPWPNFVQSVREQIEKIVVSHRPRKKVSGALHEETFYSAPGGDANPRLRSVRKPLSNLSETEVGDIVDRRVREIVREKLRELGTNDPDKAFAEPNALPHLESSDGRRIPIKSVRLFKKLPTYAVGSGRTARHVASDSNHHIEIFAELDAAGSEVEWDGTVVTLANSQERLRARQPIVERAYGTNRKFIFSLSPGEVIECNVDSGGRDFYVMRKMSQLSTGQIQLGFAPVRDARQAKIMQKSRAWLWAGPDSLRNRNARKVVIGPLGDVSESHD